MGYSLALRMLRILWCFLTLRSIGKQTHFEYCLNKAKKIFWTCRNEIGKTWGLSPKIIYRIYRMIICLVVTYGSIVWWSRGKLGSAQRDLTKLQRMICIAMTGCIKTTPMVSLKLFLGLFPLSKCIEAEAIICMKRFKYLGQWKAFSDYLSGKNLNCEILEHPSLIMPYDDMPARYVFDKPYQVLVFSRND